MTEQIKHNTPALVEETLVTYGVWDTVSFLLVSHHLRQRDYEAWRMGGMTCLEDAIAGDSKPMMEMLNAALLHAESMGLIGESITWHGWGKHSGHTLRLFHDDARNARFQLRLSPTSNRPQLDLFMDAPHTILLNRLRQTLLSRSPEFDALFDRALDEIINEPALARLDVIRIAMTTPSLSRPVAWFNYLREVIAPACRDEFHHHSIDIMAPLWRAAAHAMLDSITIAFDPAHPDHHSSHAFLLAHDWEPCLASVEQIPDWLDQPALHTRRIAALSAMRQHETEREAWMMYCWRCPDHAATALNEANLHACGLHGLWQQFSQSETAPDITDFPALIALQHRTSPTQATIFEHAQHNQGWQHYQQITALLASEQQGDTDIPLRTALKTSSAWLFQAFMATRH